MQRRQRAQRALWAPTAPRAQVHRRLALQARTGARRASQLQRARVRVRRAFVSVRAASRRRTSRALRASSAPQSARPWALRARRARTASLVLAPSRNAPRGRLRAQPPRFRRQHAPCAQRVRTLRRVRRHAPRARRATSAKSAHQRSRPAPRASTASPTPATRRRAHRAPTAARRASQPRRVRVHAVWAFASARVAQRRQASRVPRASSVPRLARPRARLAP
jgi:hypothetical protein